MRKWLIFAAALCLLLSGCGPTVQPEPTPTPTAAPQPEAAEFALAWYPGVSLHPITGDNRTNLTLGGLLYEGLYALDGQFQPEPCLSTGGTASEDGLSWTFPLRSGVTFSDGSPLTAAEAAASLELARTSPLYSARLADITGVEAGEGSVTVTLSRPNGALPALLDIPIVKETDGAPLGTGPYVLTGEGEGAVLTARADWWRGAELPLETIPLRPIQEADDLIHAFDTRDVALVATDLTGTNALGFSGTFDTVDYPTSTMLYVGFNTASGPCRSAEVRQALSRAFDRASIATVLYARHAQAAALPVSPASPLYQADVAAELDHDPQAAGALLEQAGRQDLALTLLAPADNPARTAAAELLADGLENLGLSVTLDLLPWPDYLAALERGDFDLYLGEVRLTADFDLTALLAGALNYGGYADEEALQRLDSFRAASGQGRDLSARRLYQRLAEEPPFAVLCFKNWSVLTQWSRIQGLTPTQSNVFHAFDQWVLT